MAHSNCSYGRESICAEGFVCVCVCVCVCVLSDLAYCCVSISQVGADGMHLTLDLIYPFICSILFFIAPFISLSPSLFFPIPVCFMSFQLLLLSISFKGTVTQKIKICHHLLTLISFQNVSFLFSKEQKSQFNLMS